MSVATCVAISCSSRDVALTFHHLVTDVMHVLSDYPVRVLYGGGHKGLMGRVRQQATAVGLPVVGFNLAQWHTVPDDVVLSSLSERQNAVLNADVALFLPGGIGTLYELTQVLCEADVAERYRLIVVYDPLHYFDPFFAWYDTIIAQGIGSPLKYHHVRSPQDLRNVLDKNLPCDNK